MSDPRTTFEHLPTLTEVLPSGQQPAGPSVLVDQVLADLHRQIDAALPQLVQQAMAPALAQAVERLLHETRLALARTLREQVEQALARAVAHELAEPPLLAGGSAETRPTGGG